MARYLYMTAEGMVRGPFWLSQMRELWKKGQINQSTEVCVDGTRRWEPVEFYPEIYEDDARMPVLARWRGRETAPARRVVGLIVIGLLVVLWLMQRQV